MDQGEFWKLIDSTQGHADRGARLTELLKSYSPEQIVPFRLHYDDAMQAAHTVDLWGACHLIHGGCDDDSFFDFREALLERGRTVFEQAIQNPDSLADIVEPGTPLVPLENLGWAIVAAWTALTGQSEDDFFAELDRVDTKDRTTLEAGDWWNFDDADEVRHRLPKLAARFLRAGE